MTRLSVFHILTVVILVVLAGCGGASFDALTGPDRAAAETDESPHRRPTRCRARTGRSRSTISTSARGEHVGRRAVERDDVDRLRRLVGRRRGRALVSGGRDIDRIDYLVTTHADADHIGGHAAIIEHFETEGDGVGAVYDPGIASSSQTYGRYLDAVEEHDVTLYETRSGDTIPFEGVETTVLMPPEEYVANGDRNENSVALHLGFGESSFLLPGDTEDAGEEFPRRRVRGFTEHNGVAGRPPRESLQFERRLPRGEPAADSVDFERLRLPVRSPHEEVLQRFSDRSVETYWTATHGTVRMTSNGSAVTVATQRDAPTDPLELREGRRSNPVPLTTCRCGLSST